jgi:hypothetical protein
MAQDGAARQAAYERRKRDRAMTMATTLHLLARDDDAICRKLDLPTLEAMRDSLTLAGKAGRDVEAWIASLTENQGTASFSSHQREELPVVLPSSGKPRKQPAPSRH